MTKVGFLLQLGGIFLSMGFSIIAESLEKQLLHASSLSNLNRRLINCF